MKFMIQSTPVNQESWPKDLLARFQACKTVVQEGLADGTTECAYMVVGSNKSVSIVDAPSHELLWQALAIYPMAPFLAFEVTPLVDMDFFFDRVIASYQAG